jgi:hypothetical protein
MSRAIPILEAPQLFGQQNYRDVLKREMDGGKIPLSLGKKCPVKCEFCYELDHSYRETLDPPKTTQEDWEFMLNYINSRPTDPLQFWCLGGNEFMEWTDLFLHPKAMEWLEDFLKHTDKNVQFFTVGFVHVPKIHRLVEQYPGRINFELSVITLGEYRQKLMPHAPSVKHLMKVLDGPAVSAANFYAFDKHTMSEDAKTISKINSKCVLWMGCLTPVGGINESIKTIMRQGRQYLPIEAEKIYDASLPNSTTIHTEAYVTAFSKFLWVPNSTLGGDSDCTVLLTLNDIAKCLTNEKYVYIPQCILESGRGSGRDIAGVHVDEFVRKTGVKVRMLRKIDTKFANNRLYRNGSLQNYVEDYVRNPLTRSYEAFPLTA